MIKTFIEKMRGDIIEDKDFFTTCIKTLCIDSLYLLCQTLVVLRQYSSSGVDTAKINVIVAYITPYLSGSDFGKAFFEKVVRDVADIYQIFEHSLGMRPGSKPFTMAMKKGFRAFLEEQDAYTLLSNRGILKDVIIPATHLKPNKTDYLFNGEYHMYVADIIMQDKFEDFREMFEELEKNRVQKPVEKVELSTEEFLEEVLKIVI